MRWLAKRDLPDSNYMSHALVFQQRRMMARTLCVAPSNQQLASAFCLELCPFQKAAATEDPPCHSARASAHREKAALIDGGTLAMICDHSYVIL